MFIIAPDSAGRGLEPEMPLSSTFFFYSAVLFIFSAFKRVLYLLPKISMFCSLSQNSQQLFEKIKIL